MEITVLSEEENSLLHRTDVQFEIVHEEATPSRLSVRDSLAAKLDKDSDEVVVHRIDTKFGMRRTVGYAKVYESPSYAREIEQEYMLDRNKIATDGSTEAAPEDGESDAAADAADTAAADEADEGAAAEEGDEADEGETGDADDEGGEAEDESEVEGSEDEPEASEDEPATAEEVEE